MVMPGETVATGASDTCKDCGVKMTPQVCRSSAGYYVGCQCNCGPYSRESSYFKNEVDATRALHLGNYSR
jgi:hypothetical protein